MRLHELIKGLNVEIKRNQKIRVMEIEKGSGEADRESRESGVLEIK